MLWILRGGMGVHSRAQNSFLSQVASYQDSYEDLTLVPPGDRAVGTQGGLFVSEH